MTKRYDAIVLGAGPAGLTAGIYLSRAKKRVLVIDQGAAGGQPILTHKVANYPGLPEVNGYELAFALKSQAQRFGCELESNVEVTRIDLEGETKRVEVDGEDLYEAPVLIVATGGVARGLGLDSEERFKAHGISYCATCDGDFFTGKDIVVVGGGNTALQEAVALTEHARSVTVLHQFDHFQAFPEAVEEAEKNPKIRFVMEAEVVAFEGGETLERVRYRHRPTGEEHVIDTAGVFLFIGYVPNSAPFRGRLALSPAGEIVTDDQMATSVRGVFAAGDVRQKRYRQLTTAVSDGTIAALAAMEFISHRATDQAKDAKTGSVASRRPGAPRAEVEAAPTLT